MEESHLIVIPLFLRSSSLLRLGLSPLLPHTHQPSLAPRIPQLSVSSFLTLWHIALLDLANGFLFRLVDDRHGMMGLL